MPSLRLLQPTAILAASVAVAACGGGGSDRTATTTGPQTGTLTVALFDAPRWDVAEINLVMTALNIKPAEGPAIEFDFDPAVNVNLLALTPDNAETLLDGVTVPAGPYNWMELEVDAVFDGLTDDSNVVENDGNVYELRVPSGSVRLVSGFTVTANQETSFMIDWDARQGLVRPPGQADANGIYRYMLRPAFRIIDETEFGTLEGMVAMDLITPATEANGCNDDTDTDDPDVGNVVYVFAGLGATADDIDGIDVATDPNVDPVATIEVAQNTEGDYVYSAILSPGDYTVAFTCQAGLDDPETDDTLLFIDGGDFSLDADETETVNF